MAVLNMPNMIERRKTEKESVCAREKEVKREKYEKVEKERNKRRERKKRKKFLKKTPSPKMQK